MFKDFLITESKQEIVNLGFPPMIASMIQQRFGKAAFLLAKWYRDFTAPQADEDWFRMRHYSSRDVNINDLMLLYDSAKDSETYKKALKHLGMNDREEFYDPYSLREQREALKKQIESLFFEETFFTYYQFINEIISGQLRDLAPYRDLSFWQALEKYEKKRIFQDMQPLKTYPNGYRWINVGKRCPLVGSLMKNCGSAGAMSWDKDVTILALFDKSNKPHAVVTYSPNEKRISGDEGVASSAVKTIYHNYILDLAKTLGVAFDADKTKSTFLKIKYLLRNTATNIQRVGKVDTYNEFFVFTTKDGRQYYTNGYTVLSDEDLQKLRTMSLPNKTGSMVGNAFNRYNMDAVKDAVQYIPLTQFAS